MNRRFHWHTGFLVVLVLAAVSCGAPAIKYNYAKEPDPRGLEHKLGVTDEIRVTVRGLNDVSGRYAVPEQGSITFPLIGAVAVRGKTATEIRAAVEAKLKDYVKGEAAKVTIVVASISSYKFTVSGEVVRANLFTPKTYVTITEALALAGGFSRFANRSRMYILRDNHGKGFKKIPINYDAIVSGRRPEMNIVILSGDVVHVP